MFSVRGYTLINKIMPQKLQEYAAHDPARLDAGDFHRCLPIMKVICSKLETVARNVRSAAMAGPRHGGNISFVTL